MLKHYPARPSPLLKPLRWYVFLLTIFCWGFIGGYAISYYSTVVDDGSCYLEVYYSIPVLRFLYAILMVFGYIVVPSIVMLYWNFRMYKKVKQMSRVAPIVGSSTRGRADGKRLLKAERDMNLVATMLGLIGMMIEYFI